MALVRIVPFQVSTQQGGGALALMGEPFDADQAKFVPTSAQDFTSTQVRPKIRFFRLKIRSTVGGVDTWRCFCSSRLKVSCMNNVLMLHFVFFCFGR